MGDEEKNGDASEKEPALEINQTEKNEESSQHSMLQHYVIGGVAGLVVGIYSYLAIFIGTVDYDVTYRFSEKEYVLGIVARLSISIIAGAFWVYITRRRCQGFNHFSLVY